MAGSKDNARIEDVNKALHQRFGGGYFAVGSKPGAKGCIVWHVKNPIPAITQMFEKNADLFHAVLDPRYHPGKTWPPDPLNLFGDIRNINIGIQEQIRDIKNNMDKYTDIYETLELYPIDMNKPIMPQLRKIHNKLKHRL